MKNLRRLLALVAVGGVFAWGYDNYSGYVRMAYQRRAYPPIRETSPLAEDLNRAIKAREDREYMTEFRRVNAKLLEAQRNGHNVTELKAKMPNAARLGRQRKFKWGFAILNSIDVRIPRFKSGVVRAADGGDSYLGEETR